jgi:hypothetical protein
VATPPSERLWPKVDRRGPDECWPWLGAKTETGYGMLTTKRGNGTWTTVRAHRVAYEAAVGPIPPCPHRACCNPAHMRVVTQDVNWARRRWRERTHCPHGHAYTPQNTKIGSKGEKKCRTCHRAQEAARRAARANPS